MTDHEKEEKKREVPDEDNQGGVIKRFEDAGLR